VTKDFRTSARLDRGIIREILAAVLLIAGLTGLVVAGFAVDWRLGLTALSAMAATAGALLGYER
jgi:hypothetical protein